MLFMKQVQDFFMEITGVLTPSNDCCFETYYNNNMYPIRTSKLNHHAQHNCIVRITQEARSYSIAHTF